MHPKNISIEQYNYELPDELIAKSPLAKRDESKLLVFKNNKFEESQYKHIHNYIPKNSLVCFNETKVVNARLYFQKSTGAIIEIFCLEPHSDYKDIATAMAQTHKVIWKCLIGGVSKWKNEEYLNNINNNNTIALKAKLLNKLTDGYEVLLEWNTQHSFAEILTTLGEIPLPPYLNRKPEQSDYNSYQTMFAKYEGSVAAPTASLHFTPEILSNFKTKNIQTTHVTLHVGAGTFKPVKSATLEDHEMHPEFIDVSIATVKQLIQQLEINEPIIAVGTTSVRTIESLYWLGYLLYNKQEVSWQDIAIHQWLPYETNNNELKPIDALKTLLDYLVSNNLNKLVTKTQIIIAPSYSFKIINAIITNFHQPKSTLLLLVSALIGSSWEKVYQHAKNNNFRFLSYGDGCLLFKS